MARAQRAAQPQALQELQRKQGQCGLPCGYICEAQTIYINAHIPYISIYIAKPLDIYRRALSRPANPATFPHMQAITASKTAGPLRSARASKQPQDARPSPRVRAAIEAMVWQGLRRQDAAKAAGIADHTLYQNLRKPSVLRYLHEQMDVLRNAERPRNLARLTEIRDQDANLTAAVQAIKLLEPPREDAGRPVQVSVTAGVVIRAPEQARSSLDRANTLELKANTVTDMVRSDLANDPSVLLFDDGGGTDGA